MNKILTISTQFYEDYNMDSSIPYWKAKGGYDYALAIIDDEYEFIAPLVANYYAKEYLQTNEVITSVQLVDLFDGIVRMQFGFANSYEEWEAQQEQGGRLDMWVPGKLYLPEIKYPRNVTEAIWTNPDQPKRILLEEKAA